jgi:TPR repeat protein
LVKYNLGCSYIKGEGLEKDFQKGYEIFEECAAYGYNSAIRSLGLRYYRGKDGYEVNYVLAKKYFDEAAEQYDTKSMIYLGEMYASGLGVSVDVQNAVDWYKKAAELDNFDAQAILAVMLIDEAYGEKQPEQAYSYMKESAENGIVTSMYNMAVCIVNGEFWWETKETAKYWLEKAASAGDEDAKNLLETFE